MAGSNQVKQPINPTASPDRSASSLIPTKQTPLTSPTKQVLRRPAPKPKLWPHNSKPNTKLMEPCHATTISRRSRKPSRLAKPTPLAGPWASRREVLPRDLWLPRCSLKLVTSRRAPALLRCNPLRPEPLMQIKESEQRRNEVSQKMRSDKNQ